MLGRGPGTGAQSPVFPLWTTLSLTPSRVRLFTRPASPCVAPTTDVAARAAVALGKSLRPSTVWRILAADALKPWRYRYWIFPRDPPLCEQAGRLLDLSAGWWQGEPLRAPDHIISADEKTSIPARLRCHPSLPPAPGRALRLAHAYERGGALPSLAAWDVRRGRVMGRCEPATGIVPCGRWSPKEWSGSPTARRRVSAGWSIMARRIGAKRLSTGWPRQIRI